MVTLVVTSPPEPAATQVSAITPTAFDSAAATAAAANVTATHWAATKEASSVGQTPTPPLPTVTQTPTTVPPTATKTPAPPAATPKPTATRPRPIATKSTCPSWYQAPQPGKGVLLIENHMGADIQIEQIKGGTGTWWVKKKEGDVPGRLLLQLPPGDHEFEDQLPGWGGGVIRVKIVAGKSFISPLFDNSRREELVYPLDPPAGCK